MATVRERLTGELLQCYPEPGLLYDRIAAWLGVGGDQLLFHTGSDLEIKAVFETYIGRGDRILLHQPGYAMYQVYARMFQAEVETQDYDVELRFDLDHFSERLDSRHRLVVLENPNGFVGNCHPLTKIRELVRKANRLGVIALLDEAYFHFIDETLAAELAAFDNLIVVRTFSKAFGLAGVRAAYLLANPAMIRDLGRVKPMHELSGLAVMLIGALLDQPQEMERFVLETAASRDYLRAALAELGIATSDSRANFVAARLGPRLDGDRAARQLRESGILIRRPFREPHLREWLRVGTAPLPVMERLVAGLRGLLDERKS